MWQEHGGEGDAIRVSTVSVLSGGQGSTALIDVSRDLLIVRFKVAA